VCCNVLQCVAVCCSQMQIPTLQVVWLELCGVCCSVLQCIEVCCNVLLQCVAVCCSQYIHVYIHMYVYTNMHISCIVLMHGKCVDDVPECVCVCERERDRGCVCVCASVM